MSALPVCPSNLTRSLPGHARDVPPAIYQYLKHPLSIVTPHGKVSNGSSERLYKHRDFMVDEARSLVEMR